MSYQGDQFLLDHAQVSMIEEPEAKPNFISVSEYAAINGVHKHTVLNWIKAGKIQYSQKQHGVYIRFYVPSNAKPPMVRPDRSILTSP